MREKYMEEKSTVKDKKDVLANLVMSLCLEMGKCMKHNPDYVDFIEDEIDKFNESVSRGNWHCNIGAKRVLYEENNGNNNLQYTPRATEIARKILGYTNKKMNN